MTLIYYHYKIYCYGLWKHIRNYDNKLFYVNYHYFSLFSWLFHVFHCLVQYMVHHCFFILFQCVALSFRCFSILLLRVFMFSLCFLIFDSFPSFVTRLHCFFECFLFVLTSTCSLSFLQRCSLHFIAFHFFKCCSLYLIDFPGFYVSLCTSQCFHFFKVVHCLFLAGFCLFSIHI
jgi:hypothetical protein